MEDLYPVCKYLNDKYNEETDDKEVLEYDCSLYDKELKQCIVTKRECGRFVR